MKAASHVPPLLAGLNLLLALWASTAQAQGSDEAVCTASGGVWDATACGPSVCGVPNMADCVLPACQCPPDSNFVVGMGCQPDPMCEVLPGGLTMATACINDGSVEFCVPNDEHAMALVSSIAPEAGFSGSGGRAGCLGGGRLLCMVPVAAWCSDGSSTMSLAGWEVLRQLAALPFVERIVATWYE